MKTNTKDIIKNNYSSILKLVRDEGWNISEAVSKFGVCRSVFYRTITKEQKQELSLAKTLHTSKDLYSKYMITD